MSAQPEKQNRTLCSRGGVGEVQCHMRHSRLPSEGVIEQGPPGETMGTAVHTPAVGRSPQSTEKAVQLGWGPVGWGNGLGVYSGCTGAPCCLSRAVTDLPWF